MRDRTVARHSPDHTLEAHLLSENLAMAKYALASGLKVSPGLMQTLDDLTDQLQLEMSESANHESQDQPEFGNGKKPQNHTVQRLTQIHIRLAEILAPASPRTVLLLENESRSPRMWSFIGPVGLIRRMMLLAIFFLAAFIALGVSPSVNANSISRGIFESAGIILLLNLLFLLTAAGLGACFAGLFHANRYVADNTYDPKYEASYWVRVVLGLMAGIILAELIPLDFSGSGTVQALGKPVLALLGGFSAAAVYRIISKIVDSLESLVRGNGREIAAAQSQVAKAQYESQLTEHRLALAANLTRIQQKIDSTSDPEELKQELDKVLSSLIPQNNFEDQN